MRRTSFQSFFLPVRLPGQRDLVSVMGQAVHHGIGHDLVREGIEPVLERPVTGEDGRAGVVTIINDALEPVGRAAVEFFRPELIQDEQVAPVQGLQEALDRAGQ